MWLYVLAISGGAALGANARWLLGLWLNALFPALPLGTLAANLLGGWLIGLALGVFAWLPALAPEWRLFLVTGFLGALTTFSTFSAEMFGAGRHRRARGRLPGDDRPGLRHGGAGARPAVAPVRPRGAPPEASRRAV